MSTIKDGGTKCFVINATTESGAKTSPNALDHLYTNLPTGQGLRQPAPLFKKLDESVI